MTASEPKNPRSYTQEDVQQILQLAIARQADDHDQEFSYQQILEIAGELAISPDILQKAESAWLTGQSDVERRQTFHIYRQGKLKKRVVNYLIINVFLTLMDLIGGGGLSWSLYILLFCGLVTVLDAWNTFQTKGEDYENAFQRWNRQHQIKQTVNVVLNKWFKVFKN
jgi:hypothetical protein